MGTSRYYTRVWVKENCPEAVSQGAVSKISRAVGAAYGLKLPVTLPRV